MRTLVAAVLSTLGLIAALIPNLAVADTSWLDQPLTNWNQAGMALPQAPPMDPVTNPQCLPQGRPRAWPAAATGACHVDGIHHRLELVLSCTWPAVNTLNQWRAVATGHDQRAINYRATATATIAALMIWHNS